MPVEPRLLKTKKICSLTHVGEFFFPSQSESCTCYAPAERGRVVKHSGGGMDERRSTSETQGASSMSTINSFAHQFQSPPSALPQMLLLSDDGVSLQAGLCTRQRKEHVGSMLLFEWSVSCSIQSLKTDGAQCRARKRGGIDGKGRWAEGGFNYLWQ